MSGAPETACDSHRKPVTSVPSARSTLPTPSGDGIAATNSPRPAASMAHTSTSMAAPSLGERTSPGFGGLVGSAYRRYSAAVVVRALSTAPPSGSWGVSGRPARGAPTPALRNRGASGAGPGAGEGAGGA